MNKQQAEDISELLHVFGLHYSTYEAAEEREEIKNWEMYKAAERLYNNLQVEIATKLAEAEVRKHTKELNPGEKLVDPKGWVKRVVAQFQQNSESFDNWLNNNY